jgi:predicted membrane-bound mannosyltransferase
VTFRAASILIVVAAAFLRITDLSDRPMHADEDVFARKLGTLLETGSWDYEPGEYHGPVLHNVTAAVAYAAGARGYTSLTEQTLRLVPAVIGVVLVAIPLLVAHQIGRIPALTAAALTAISPAMVYYSRYYIPEMLLVTLTAALAAFVHRIFVTKRLVWALAGGLALGLMFATKETAVIAAVALFLAVRRLPPWRSSIAAVGVTVVVILTLIGPWEAAESVRAYLQRAVGGERHVHPWHYYLGLLLRKETIIVALALVALAGRGLHDAERTAARTVAAYTLVMAIVYSAIPYKTPWCVLGLLHGMIVLAGFGVASLWRAAKPMAVAVLVIGGAHLGYQAYAVSWPQATDPANPYAYAHTSRGVYAIRERLQSMAAASESGTQIRLQVISTQNIWPLPWYLRAFPNVEWHRKIAADLRPAAIILATPEVEPALLHHLYEVMPPGQRPLYVPLFAGYTELRPGLELRGYVQQSLAAAIP